MRKGKIRNSKIRAAIIDWSKGDFLWIYWKLFAWRSQISYLPFQDVLSFFLLRMAHKHGGTSAEIPRFKVCRFYLTVCMGFIFPAMQKSERVATSIKMSRLALSGNRPRRLEITVSLEPGQSSLVISKWGIMRKSEPER